MGIWEQHGSWQLFAAEFVRLIAVAPAIRALSADHSDHVSDSFGALQRSHRRIKTTLSKANQDHLRQTRIWEAIFATFHFPMTWREGLSRKLSQLDATRLPVTSAICLRDP